LRRIISIRQRPSAWEIVPGGRRKEEAEPALNPKWKLIAANLHTLIRSNFGFPVKEPLIKASSAASWSFSCLFEPLFPHSSSERLRKIVSKNHRNCLRFRQASFNQ